ncbi:MAG: biotin transporter BioY, partial [bacterium]
MTTQTIHPTLAAELWRSHGDPQQATIHRRLRAAFRAVALAVAGSLLLALSAQAQIPFYPVPMTMQTFAVLLLGVAYGWRLGAATVLLYLAAGAAGLPVFAGGAGGAGVLVGPTGDYL